MYITNHNSKYEPMVKTMTRLLEEGIGEIRDESVHPLSVTPSL